MQAPTVFHIDRLELSFAPKPWAFAVERRAEIDAYFSALMREKPLGSKSGIELARERETLVPAAT